MQQEIKITTQLTAVKIIRQHMVLKEIVDENRIIIRMAMFSKALNLPRRENLCRLCMIWVQIFRILQNFLQMHTTKQTLATLKTDHIKPQLIKRTQEKTGTPQVMINEDRIQIVTQVHRTTRKERCITTTWLIRNSIRLHVGKITFLLQHRLNLPNLRRLPREMLRKGRTAAKAE